MDLQIGDFVRLEYTGKVVGLELSSGRILYTVEVRDDKTGCLEVISRVPKKYITVKYGQEA